MGYWPLEEDLSSYKLDSNTFRFVNNTIHNNLNAKEILNIVSSLKSENIKFEITEDWIQILP